MCKEFGQTCADEQENIRILLQIYHERSNQLANIIQASNGLIITILVGVLAFAGSVKEFEGKPFFVTLIIGLCVISIISWRAFAHYVDNDIIEMYGKILCCENKMNVPPRTSLLLSLIHGLPKKNGKREELMDLIKSENFSRAYNEMFFLIEEKKIGDRGHLTTDFFALCTCLLLIGIGGFLVYVTKPTNPIENYFGFGFIFGLLFGIIIALIYVYRYLSIAKNPD